MQTPSPVPSAFGDNPLTSTSALMLFPTSHPPITTMPLPTPSPTSMNQRPSAADQPLLAEPPPQNSSMTVPSILTCAISAATYPFPALTHHPFANLQLLAHLDHPLSKDHCDPLLLQNSYLTAPLMPTQNYRLLEDCYPNNRLSNCPWGTTVDHFPVVDPPPLADEAQRWMPFSHSVAEKEAYKTGWNYNALRFALCHALPQRIKDILCLTPKQPSYDEYKALITQIDQQYWKDHSEYSVLHAP
ncbi:hypothetical protein C0993_006800 [Termitomyces sp. T159_Od127]|nr:hypothetical protein C0993_006800 [Termitomyces sp. T159_Od127]